MNKATSDNNHEFRNCNSVISRIIKQVSNKKIQISFRQLLKIAKPEIQQDIINSITNPDIPRRNRRPSEDKRKKRFLNDTTSESSSSESGSGSDSESSNGDEDFAMDMVGESHCSAIKAKKRD